MDREKAVEFVVRELGKHHNRNEIIVTLCEQIGINWQDAEKLVREVEIQHERRIAVRQSPIAIILGVGTVLVGIGLFLNGFFFFMRLFQELGGEFSFSIVLGLRYVYFEIGQLITGLAMVLGGSIGSARVLSKVLK